MPSIRITTRIGAPIAVCFDLARDIDLHVESAAHTRERAVRGITSGLIELGEDVTWEAVHFGVKQRLTSRITAFDRPFHFRDSMVRGAFAGFDHDHFFVEMGALTVMTDVFDYRLRFPPLALLPDVLFLRRHMRQFLTARCEAIRAAAEADPEAAD